MFRELGDRWGQLQAIEWLGAAAASSDRAQAEQLPGTARFSTLKSSAMTNAGSASTASPVHSRLPARRTGVTRCGVWHTQSPVIDDPRALRPAMSSSSCEGSLSVRCRSAVGLLHRHGHAVCPAPVADRPRGSMGCRRRAGHLRSGLRQDRHGERCPGPAPSSRLACTRPAASPSARSPGSASSPEYGPGWRSP